MASVSPFSCPLVQLLMMANSTSLSTPSIRGIEHHPLRELSHTHRLLNAIHPIRVMAGCLRLSENCWQFKSLPFCGELLLLRLVRAIQYTTLIVALIQIGYH
jgi:hypothetical protein